MRITCDAMCALYRAVGIFALEEPVRKVVDRIEALNLQWIHAMHGGTLTGASLPTYVRALREQRFAFEGKLLGRELPSGQSGVVMQAARAADLRLST